jgi:hypothetical protein
VKVLMTSARRSFLPRRYKVLFTRARFHGSPPSGVDVATLIPAVAVVSRVVVPREKRYLENRFGQQYSSYRDSARRWL